MKIFLLLLLLLTTTITLFAQEGVAIKGGDTPNDRGGSITLSWTTPENLKLTAVKIQILRKEVGSVEFKQVKEVGIEATEYNDKNEVVDLKPYLYKLSFSDLNGKSLYSSSELGPFIATPQWFNTSKIGVLIFSIITITMLLIFIHLAKRGKKLYIRPLAGVKAIEDAVGRATEMGKPMIYSAGIASIDEIGTLASLSILSKVSEIVAEYETRMIMPIADAIVYSVADEVIRNAYTKTGHPDAYRSEDVYFLTERQFAYAAGVSGLMSREKPAANLFLGYFMAESLILAEAGAATGAIQISGTDSISQIPFFIVACDYTLIGEELYAAGAVMGDDAKLRGGIKGQDYIKLIVMITIVVLFILKLCGVQGISTLLTGGA